jgi:hypothetical protein
MSDPDHDSRGFGLRVLGFSILIIAILLILFGNWVVSQPDEPLTQTAAGDAFFGIAGCLVLVSFGLTVVGLIVGRHARQTSHSND